MYRLRRLCTAALFILPVLGVGSGPAGNVRVRLFAGRMVTSLTVADAKTGRLTLYDSSGALATVDDHQSIEFDIWHEFLRARWRSGNVPLDRAVLKAESGIVALTLDGKTVSYRGSVELVLENDVDLPAIVVINEVALPDYVTSVLPAEFGFKEPEGLKAQAIVIRTYALRARGQAGNLYDLTDDTGSQVYSGVSSETDLARSAVEATSGMVLTYDGEPIEAVYSAHCGGHSADNEDVWNSRPVPYLRGRKDPYDADAPVAEWASTIKRKELLDHLSRLYGVKVRNVQVAERGSGHRATTVKLDADRDVKITAQSFRVAVNERFGGNAVKSTLFDLSREGDSYVFSGRGLGHGVGLCQWGAAEQARRGRSFKDILAFYYRDVDIEGRESDVPMAGRAIAEVDTEVKYVRDERPPKEDPKVDRAEPFNERGADPPQKGGSRKLSGRRVGW